MRFAKMHGLGNDFVMVNGFKEKLPDDLNRLAIAVCDRHLGIGADGLIVLCPADKDATARFLIYNDDGSQAESCGNGLRCAALFAKQEGITTDNDFIFELVNGIARARRSLMNKRESSVSIWINPDWPRSRYRLILAAVR